MTSTSNPSRTAADHAFVTLITSDSYLPGALAQSAALNDLHPTRRGGQFPSGLGLEEEADPVPFTTVCLVTPETVSVGTIKQLRRTFDLVIGVELIEGDRNSQEIKLLGRPDLHQTFTKLHVLRLAQFASLVFLDADVLPLRPMSHLLNMVSSWPDEYFQDDGEAKTATAVNPGDILTLDASTVTKRNPHRLHNPAYPCPVSAAPDSGWPDIFNSGVIVLAPPGERGFKQAMSQRSWDGGDQGTLNEWAGNQAGLSTGQGTGGPGWNRLSFKYNVTPTAAYTYAPAYAKFGTGVHAVHFIGGSKPWSGLSFRPPFISSSGKEASTYDISAYSAGAKGTTPQWRETAYSYHILVDRWYAVYDAHFRAETDEKDGPKSEFEVHKYESAWEGGKGGQEFTAYDGGVDTGATQPPADQPNQYPHVIPPRTYHVKVTSAPSEGPSATPQPASLEELRRLALHGLGQSGVVRAGEGSYVSLPMEGRFTLMRPPPPPEPEPVYVPVEVHHHHEEPFHAPPPQEQHHHEHHEHHGHHGHHGHHEHHEHHHHHHHEHHHRPPSPPIIAWNPAYEPPPTTAPAHTNNFPANAWYENQWDMPATKDYHHGGQHSGAPEQFFQPPEPKQYIPPELIHQGHYSDLTSNGFQPDQSRIKSVFPWEDIERPAPTRAFPTSKAAPAPKVQEVPVAPAPPPPERPASPTRALGSMYLNAWDDIPSIQRYAARLTGAIPVPSKPAEPIVAAPASSAPQKEWSWERDRGDGGDASSRDGDDEDDEDSESEKERTPKASAPGTPAVGNGNGKAKSKPKSPPSGSISSSASESPVAAPVGTGLPATTPAQTSTPTPVAQFSRASNPPLRGFELYLSEKRKAQGALDGPKDIRERLALPIGRSTAPIYAPGDEAEMPVLLQIPMSDKPKIAGDVGSALPALGEPSFESSRPRRVSSTAIPFSVVATLGSTLQIPSHTRNDSDSSDGELTDDGSSTGSTGPSSPYEYDPSSAPAPMRTWDDARSVDAFKRDSHEALARFLKRSPPGGSSPQNV